MADVICLGILIADLFGSPMDTLPAAGELALIDRYLLSAGGCASNAAAALGRLGRSPRVLGKVGNDLLGSFVVQDLRRLGVETSFVKKTSAHPTSYTFILNVRGDDRRYIHCGGANLDFSLADVDNAAFDGARAVYVGGYLAMPAFRPEHLVQLFRKAKRQGLLTALDVVIPVGHRPSLEDIRGALPYTDVFLPNNDEALVLTGRSDPLEQVRVLSGLNPDCTVVITQGREGALAKQGDKILRMGIFKVDSIDESGCGDAFSAGFLVGMLENWPLEESLRFATAAGGLALWLWGATTESFPSMRP
jgi:sugar/nucleoside kinase (ribokinase family)